MTAFVIQESDRETIDRIARGIERARTPEQMRRWVKSTESWCAFARITHQADCWCAEFERLNRLAMARLGELEAAG